MRVLKGVVLAGLVLGVVTGAQAQEKLRVGVLDVRKVIFESKPGQAQRVERDKLMKEKRDQIAREESAIRALHEKFEKDKLVLTDKQKEQKQAELKERIAAFQKMSQQAQQEMSKRDNESLAKIDAVLQGIVSEIGKQEKLAFVIDRGQPGVVWVDEPVDITDKVFKAYEAKGGK